MQQRLDGLLHALAHPGMLPGAVRHALDVKAVLDLADGLIQKAPGILTHLRHRGFDVPRIGRTHPAAAVVAAGVALADLAKFRGQYDLPLGNESRLGRPGSQGGFDQTVFKLAHGRSPSRSALKGVEQGANVVPAGMGRNVVAGGGLEE